MKTVRFTITLAIAALACGLAVGVLLFAPAQPRITLTDEGHRG